MKNDIAYKDISVNQDESVIAYFVKNVDWWEDEFDVYQRAYDMYIVGNGTIQLTNGENLFSRFFYLENVEGLSILDTSNLNNINSFFFECRYLENVDFSGFNTSKVTDMGFVFCGCSSLETIDLSSFDTKNVENMESMFGGCKVVKKAYARSQEDADKLNRSEYKPATFSFEVK